MSLNKSFYISIPYHPIISLNMVLLNPNVTTPYILKDKELALFFLLVYIDDIIIVGPFVELVNQVNEFLR